jgi:hypothetical protein
VLRRTDTKAAESAIFLGAPCRSPFACFKFEECPLLPGKNPAVAIHDWNTPDRVTVNDNYKLRWNSMSRLGNIYERDQSRELIMMRLAFAIGLLALGFTAATPARADFAVVEFRSGYCRIWDHTIFGPEDGRYLHFPYQWSWHYRFHTFEGANMAMHWAVAHHRCHHWS